MGNKRSSVNVSSAASAYIVVSRTQTVIIDLEKQMSAAMRRLSEMSESLDVQTRAQVEEFVKSNSDIISLLAARSTAIKKVVDDLLGTAIALDEKGKRNMAALNDETKATKDKLTKR